MLPGNKAVLWSIPMKALPRVHEGHVHSDDEHDTEASEEPHDHELMIEDDHTLPPYIGVLFCKPDLHDHS